MSEIRHLEINYKIDELPGNLKAFGNKDLYMVNELNSQMIDVSSDSPLYSIFVRDQLGARMALLKRDDVKETYFLDFEDCILLQKLEVLPKYQNRGHVLELTGSARSFDIPIKAIDRNDSKDFFLHREFTDVEAKDIEGHDVLSWKP